jgi:hypothetical protein
MTCRGLSWSFKQDPANPGIELCNGLRVPVIVGDAQLERTLHAAGLRHADRLLAVCSVDAVNTEIVAAARRLAADRPSRDLRCLARIGDPELCALLLIQEANLAGDSLSLDFFSTDEISARLLLDDFPIDTGAGQPQIAVAYLDALGVRLVLHAARGWFEDRTDAATPLWITVIDDHAEERVRSLLDQYPALEHVCRFICACASLRDIHGVAARHADKGAPPLTRGYITAHRDEEALETALVLRHHLDASVPLVVALSQRHEVARLINDVSTECSRTPTCFRHSSARARGAHRGRAVRDDRARHRGPSPTNRARSRAARRRAASWSSWPASGPRSHPCVTGAHQISNSPARKSKGSRSVSTNAG